ncbi:MAG: hypothetical protein AAGA12_11875 [Pseudomonadota bacterium]
MSFEYFFIPSKMPFDETPLEEFFDGRRHYSVKKGTARYENLGTGVQFTIEFGTGLVTAGESELPLDETRLILFLDYLVPTFFAQEAALEIEALMDTFELRIYDPQDERMQNGAFNAELFVSDYRKHATAAARSLHEEFKSTEWPGTASRAALDKVWDWNYWRDDLQIALDEELFVPTIEFVHHEGSVKTAVVWGDGVPALLPKVDVVLAGYMEIAPKAGLLRRQKRFFDYIPYDEFKEEFADVLHPNEDVEGALQCVREDAETVIEKLKSRAPRAKQYLDAPQRKRLFETKRPAEIVDQELTAS